MKRMINRRSAWILAAALGLGMCAPWAGAADTVNLDKVPPPARQQIQQASQGGSQVVVHDVGAVGSNKNVFRAYYTDPSGKRMVISVAEDGTVLSQGVTQAQRRKDAQAQLEAAKTDAERAQIEAQLQAQRDAEDKQQALAAQAAQAQPASAQLSPTPAPPSLPGKASPNAPALNEKDLSEEYNSTDRTPVPASSLPHAVKKTLDMETLGTKNIDYYKYDAGGKTFYSAHYDVGPDQRTITRVDDKGKLLGKNQLNPAADAADKNGATPTPKNEK